MEPKITITNTVKNRIETFKVGYIFTYLEFEDASKNKEAIIKCLNRLVDAGKLHKLYKGKYYRPIMGGYNNLGLDVNEIIKDLLDKNGKPIGYITGFNVFNKNVFTPPIRNRIQIGRNSFKPTLYRSIYTIEFVLQKNEITSENIVMLQVLDCIKMINNIPDNNISYILSNLGNVIRKFNKSQKNLLIQSSYKYNLATRTILGIILDTEKIKKGIDGIIETLNPISTYNLNLKKIDRLLQDKCNIK